MASFHCVRCSRAVFLLQQQLPPLSGLCLPCHHERSEQRRADQAWHKFRADLLTPMQPVPVRHPLRPPADLRHL